MRCCHPWPSIAPLLAVAATVAAYGGYPPIAGHAFQPMVERGIQWRLVCHFEGGHHSLLLSHDDVIRWVGWAAGGVTMWDLVL